jgi:2-oxoglutarate ferredoxin oxidoreductase subunit gamma
MNPGAKGLLISGVGGQGIVFAGRLLARAWFAQGQHVALRHAYGAEVMGTAVHSEVVVSPDPIPCPYLEFADVAVVLHRAALGEVLPRLAPGALLVADEEVKPAGAPDGVRVEVRPFIAVAEKGQAGDAGRASPLVALGFLARLGVVDLDALHAVIGKDPASEDNRRLLHLGHSLG